jgi:hypothetical protein
VDYQRFYADLFAPLEAEIGPIDPDTIFAIMGFDGGGPLNFSTIGAGSGEPYVTYISCELAVRAEQVPSDTGRYELLCSCDDEEWVRSILTKLGQLSLEVKFGHWHTIDIGPVVAADAPIQGVLFETQCTSMVDGEIYAVFRVIGITRNEMEYKQASGSAQLVEALKAAGVYPHTAVGRASVV